MPYGAGAAVTFHDVPRSPSIVASLSGAVFVVAIHASSFDATFAGAAARFPRPGPPLESTHHLVVVDSGDVVIAVDARLTIAGLFRERSQVHFAIGRFRLFVQHDALDEALLHALAASDGAGVPLAGAPEAAGHLIALLLFRRFRGAAFVQSLDVIDTIVATYVALAYAGAASLGARSPRSRPPVCLSGGSELSWWRLARTVIARSIRTIVVSPLRTTGTTGTTVGNGRQCWFVGRLARW